MGGEQICWLHFFFGFETPPKKTKKGLEGAPPPVVDRGMTAGHTAGSGSGEKCEVMLGLQEGFSQTFNDIF